MIKDIKIFLEEAVLQAKEAQKWPASSTDGTDFEMPEILVDYAKNEQFGDYATNVAMILAKKVGKNPMEIAEAIKSQVESQKSQAFEKIEIAAPGYINFYLSKKYLHDVVLEIENKKEEFGNSGMGLGKKINNEFISANPTGPLHLGNGRGGFWGDSLSKVLRKAGFDVTNEYYVNDAGEQINKLKNSYDGDENAVYTGSYIEQLRKKFPDVETSAIQLSAAVLSDFIKPTISDKMGIKIDEYISEKSLYEKGYPDKALKILKEKGLTYESEGGLWLKTTNFGDDKDRVLIKSNGEKTYFAGDCGYILNKIERGFDRIIEIWGADHHGYITRFLAAARALGFEGDVRFLITQLVRLMKNGKEVRMSKRAGNVIYIDDLIEEVGHDVTRFFFLMYSPDTHMNFDLNLAKEQSQKNPVFYVQYAHARICSILAKSEISNLKSQIPDLNLLVHEKELSLIKELNKFPELVEEIAESYEVHKLPHYAVKLADKFHSFYDACRVIDEANPELTNARLFLVDAARIVLAETLKLIGVSAPKSM